MAYRDTPFSHQGGAPLRQVDRFGKIIIAVMACIAIAAGVIATLKLPVGWSSIGVAPAIAIALMATVQMNSELRYDRDREEAVRGRLRTAEDFLAASSHGLNQGRLPWTSDELRSSAAEELGKLGGDQLASAALRMAKQEQIREYIQVVISQARHSFYAAIAAAALGFCILVAAAIYAIHAHSASGAIAAGVGALGAAFAGYIGKTFIRSQEMTASRLHELFHPLTAERSAAGPQADEISA